MSPPQRRSTAIARTATATATATRHRNEHRNRNPTTAIPFAVAGTAIAVGAVLRSAAPPAAAIGGVVVLAVAAVAVVRRNDRMATADRDSATLAVAATAGVLLAAATAPVSLRLVLIAVAVAALATARIRRDPRLRRRSFLDQLTADWPATAEEIGTAARLNGPIIDRAPDGYTIRVVAPKGETASSLLHREPQIAMALNVPLSAVRVEVDEEWPASADIHIREGDPRASATADLVDPQITSGVDPLPIGPYEDGAAYLLRIFVEGLGGVDTIFAGDKGVGKSSATIRVLKLLVRGVPDITLIGWDGAGGRDLGMWEGCFFRYTTSPKEVLHHSKVVNRIVKNREKKMRENGWRVWQPSAADPILFIVVDEMATFGSSPYGIDIADNVGQSAKKNRAVGVVYLTTTQYAMGLNALGNDVLRGMHNRFQFRDQDGGASLLEEQHRKPIPRDAHGTFYGESYGETRKVSATAIWTPDEERAEIVAKWAGRQTRIDAEWEQAEREVLGTTPPTDNPEPPTADAPPAGSPKPPPSGAPAAETDDGVVDGEVLVVQPVTFEPVRDLPGRRSEMAFDEADRAFKDLLRTAGRATHEEVQQLTGWRRGRVREYLIAPAMDAGWLDYTDENGTRYYTPVPEWLEAERGE